jgi:hypothetical protein
MKHKPLFVNVAVLCLVLYCLAMLSQRNILYIYVTFEIIVRAHSAFLPPPPIVIFNLFLLPYPLLHGQHNQIVVSNNMLK